MESLSLLSPPLWICPSFRLHFLYWESTKKEGGWRSSSLLLLSFFAFNYFSSSPFSFSFVCNLEIRSTVLRSSVPPMCHPVIFSSLLLSHQRSPPRAALVRLWCKCHRLFCSILVHVLGLRLPLSPTLDLHNWYLVFAYGELQIWLHFLLRSPTSLFRKVPSSPDIKTVPLDRGFNLTTNSAHLSVVVLISVCRLQLLSRLFLL